MFAVSVNPYATIGTISSMISFLSHSENPHASFQTVLSVE